MIEPTYIDAVQNLTGNKVIHGRGHGPIAKIVLSDGVTPPTENAIQTELAKLVSVWDAQEYARNRANEYPTIADLTVALYDTDDKVAIETKRAAVKTKWPKNNTGPVE